MREMLRRFWDNLPVVTRNIFAINVIVLMLCAVVEKACVVPGTKIPYDLTWWLGMFNISLDCFNGPMTFHIWQPLTYMFMHADFWHLFCNMFTVLMFGPVIEREWGSKKYLIYYIVCGLGAAFVQQLTWMGYHAPTVTVGASGAVFGILLAFAWLFPEQKMFLLFLPIPISSRVFVGIMAFIELTSGVHPGAGDNIAHFAHLGGMLFGYLLIKLWQYMDKHGKNGRFKVYENRDYSNYHYQDPIR